MRHFYSIRIVLKIGVTRKWRFRLPFLVGGCIASFFPRKLLLGSCLHVLVSYLGHLFHFAGGVKL